MFGDKTALRTNGKPAMIYFSSAPIPQAETTESGRTLDRSEMIRNRVGSHSTGYLRHKKAGQHLHHSLEVFVRCLQGGRHNIFLLLIRLLLPNI
jgi:hypothetical protein